MTDINKNTDLFSCRLENDPDAFVAYLNDLIAGEAFGGWSWTCTAAKKPPYRVTGTLDGHESIVIEWIPRRWLSVRVPRRESARTVIRRISERILARATDGASVDALTGDRIYEWRLDGAQQRWSDLPGMRPQWGTSPG
jgi:hypothetical protein